MSLAWIKKIESTQRQLDSIKRIKFSHESEEKDYNQYSREKYTSILREDSSDSDDSDSMDPREERHPDSNQLFFQRR